jgi:putative nucleotidyltransferase with HDIG domain
MKTEAAPQPALNPARRKTLTLALIACLAFIGITAAQLSRFFVGGDVVLQPGSVALQDIRAPRRITFISEAETSRQRDLAEASVAPVFTAPDGQIARQQLGIARDLMNRISEIRADKSLSDDQRTEQLIGLQELALNEQTARTILKVDDTRWARIDAQVIILLDEVLRFSIRPDNLDGVRAQLPSRISLNFNSDEVSIITSLVSALLTPNTNYDAAATDAARQKAREAVRPVERTFEPNQVIIRSGQVVSQADMEVLDKLNIRRPAMTWADVVSALIFSALIVAIIGGTMLFGPQNALTRRVRHTALSASVFVGAIFLARLLLPGHQILPYLAPLVAITIMIAYWSGTLTGVVSAAVMAGIVGMVMDRPIEFVIFWTAGGVVAALVMRRAERISDFVRAGTFAWLAQLSVLLAFHVSTIPVDHAVQLATLVLVTSVGSLMSAALAPSLLYLSGVALDITTPFQLHELSRPSHPLIQQMLLQAPGTYHHSLMLANLAEQAAERIGADSLLTRVGAYYHDAGKIAHPYFFIENQNQTEDVNVHDQLDPLTSSRILQNHVNDGLQLARKCRLPSSIRAFISEHHGTMKTGFQYARAAQASDEPVDDAPFRYPGPRPQTKETALVMLADGSEAVVRARRPATIEETDALLRKVISERIADHQLDDTGLTLQDLEIIRQSFLDTLRGAYHPRIEYPEVGKTQKVESLPAERLQETPQAQPVVNVKGEGASA